MSRYSRIIALILVLLVTAIGACKAIPVAKRPVVRKVDFPITLEDDLSRKVVIEKEPKRIVSLAPSNTEILFALGLGDRIMGVTTYCDYPEEAKVKDKIGGFKSVNIEKVVSLKPDLVLATGGVQEPIVKELERLKITVFALDPKNLGDIISGIREVGRLTGKTEAAERIVKKMQSVMEDVKEKVAELKGKRPKVFYEVWNEPLMTAGPGTFMNDLIRLAGGENIAADAKTQYPQYSLEMLIERDPDVIIASKGSMGDPGKIEEREGWENISAVKNGRVHVIDENLVVRPGPRIVQGLKEVAKAIHPELFK
ncbi:MAG: cobalamin-binding protein [Actinomycetota bacterium]